MTTLDVASIARANRAPGTAAKVEFVKIGKSGSETHYLVKVDGWRAGWVSAKHTKVTRGLNTVSGTTYSGTICGKDWSGSRARLVKSLG